MENTKSRLNALCRSEREILKKDVNRKFSDFFPAVFAKAILFFLVYLPINSLVFVSFSAIFADYA